MHKHGILDRQTVDSMLKDHINFYTTFLLSIFYAKQISKKVFFLNKRFLYVLESNSDRLAN